MLHPFIDFHNLIKLQLIMACHECGLVPQIYSCHCRYVHLYRISFAFSSISLKQLFNDIYTLQAPCIVRYSSESLESLWPTFLALLILVKFCIKFHFFDTYCILTIQFSSLVQDSSTTISSLHFTVFEVQEWIKTN